MKRRFSLLLLLGALLGLFAQGAAFASAPAIAMSDVPIASSVMSDECAEMMGVDTSRPDSPCKGLTLDCIAKMGCALPIAVVSTVVPLTITHRRHDQVKPPAVTQLVGHTVGPELDPPLSLG